MTYPNALFSASAFLGFVMCSIPLPWHLQTSNTGTCLYMVWTGLSCFNQFINSIVWNSNAINCAPVWCDISSRFIIGSSVAIPASSLCISRRLYHVSSIRSVTRTRTERRRDVMIDLSIGLGLPFLVMGLEYIVQGHRFNIYENVGCYPAIYNTWPAYPVLWCQPIFLGLFSAFYSIGSIIHLSKRRSQLRQILSTSSTLTFNHYMRLMCLTGVELICTIPLASYIVYRNYLHINPWKSWSDTHLRFSRVDQIPAIIWPATIKPNPAEVNMKTGHL